MMGTRAEILRGTQNDRNNPLYSPLTGGFETMKPFLVFLLSLRLFPFLHREEFIS